MKEAIKRYLERTGFGQFKPKAVLFDMDGVLMNSMPNHAIAWQRSMASFGIHMTEADAYATEGARGIDTIRNLVKEQTGKVITLEESQRMYDEKTRQFGLLPKAQVMEGALEPHHLYSNWQWPAPAYQPSAHRISTRHKSTASDCLRRKHRKTRSRSLSDGNEEMWRTAAGNHCGRKCTVRGESRKCRQSIHHCYQHWYSARCYPMGSWSRYRAERNARTM